MLAPSGSQLARTVIGTGELSLLAQALSARWKAALAAGVKPT